MCKNGRRIQPAIFPSALLIRKYRISFPYDLRSENFAISNAHRSFLSLGCRHLLVYRAIAVR
jgi:hypothetical protein